jgi:ketosteroid isomerase-like protein
VLVRARYTETVRRAFSLFEAGEVEALLALYHPRIEMRVSGVLRPPAQVYAGLDRARDYLEGAIADGVNRRVEDLRLAEAGERVAVQGRLAAPDDAALRWHFDFEDGLIARIASLEADWAILGGRVFTPGHVADAPRSGSVLLDLADGRSLEAPIAGRLEAGVGPGEPVMAYFEGKRLAGWYLPGPRRGMDLR